MPSIFIWKDVVANTSKKQIKYYSGSNWMLEDDDYSSKSYMFLDQIVIPGFNDSVITFRATLMPQDWVGSELLEVTCVPYEKIKSDNYGTLEKVGDWMRFTSKNEVEFDSESLQNELVRIKKWMVEKQASSFVQPRNKHYQKSNDYHQQKENLPVLSENNIQANFQEFLNKYSIPMVSPMVLPVALPVSLPNITTNISKDTYLSNRNMSYKKDNINKGKTYNNNRKPNSN